MGMGAIFGFHPSGSLQIVSLRPMQLPQRSRSLLWLHPSVKAPHHGSIFFRSAQMHFEGCFSILPCFHGVINLENGSSDLFVQFQLVLRILFWETFFHVFCRAPFSWVIFSLLSSYPCLTEFPNFRDTSQPLLVGFSTA